MSDWVDRLPHPRPLSGASYSAVELMPENDAVVLLDQRLLPDSERYGFFGDAESVARAITDMVVRGAPAIGISAAYAMVLAAQRAREDWSALEAAAATLKAARPTAVNLAWGVDRMLRRARSLRETTVAQRIAQLAEEARRLHAEDVAANREMGRLGAARVPDGAVIQTHCNAGALATGGYGTALGVIRAAHEAGKQVRAVADETRPYLQGARLTAWELSQDGIPVDVVVDSAAAWHFSKGRIDLVVVGSDRIAANGDVANKIGTYGLACLADRHQRPFYVAAPWSTVDEDCPCGASIPIEERGAREVTHLGATRLVPDGVGVLNPAFDVTPASLVSAIFTERGVIEPVSAESLSRLSPRTGP